MKINLLSNWSVKEFTYTWCKVYVLPLYLVESVNEIVLKLHSVKNLGVQEFSFPYVLRATHVLGHFGVLHLSTINLRDGSDGSS